MRAKQDYMALGAGWPSIAGRAGPTAPHRARKHQHLMYLPSGLWCQDRPSTACREDQESANAITPLDPRRLQVHRERLLDARQAGQHSRVGGSDLLAQAHHYFAGRVHD
jgi:hypothetical protein